MIIGGYNVEECGQGAGRYWIVRDTPNSSIGLVEPREGGHGGFAAFRNGRNLGTRSELEPAVQILIDAAAQERRR